MLATLERPTAQTTKEQIIRPLDFQLPAALEARVPPEARGLARDDVRLLVSYRDGDRVVHTRFRQIAEFLDPGDLIVVNDSITIPAALRATKRWLNELDGPDLADQVLKGARISAEVVTSDEARACLEKALTR